MPQRPGILCAALDLCLGLVLIVGGPGRTSSPSFDAAEELLSMDAWGVLFLLAGIGCWLVPHLRSWQPAPVIVSAALAAFWAAVLTVTAARNPDAALTAPVVYWWVVLVHLTTIRRVAGRTAV